MVHRRALRRAGGRNRTRNRTIALAQDPERRTHGGDGSAGPDLLHHESHVLSRMSHTVRIDKWLWAARFFKTRALAAQACELGRVEIAGQRLKPSCDVRVGDKLKVTNDSGDYQIEVMRLSEMRGPASVAQTLYSESEENRTLRLKITAERRAERQFESLPRGA